MAERSDTAEQIISLPKGGGALEGIGESFSADLHTGTGNFSVPIATPPGRNGFRPNLSLAYSTGAGNGPFGLGWNLSVPGVARRTSHGLPTYDDEMDTFVLSGAEDLVAVEQRPGVTRYRPRTEGLFARIEHHDGPSGDFWQVWKVIAQLDRTAFADRLFSLRDQFPDQWYELHNPQSPTAPATIEFDLSADFFPSNLDSITTSQLAMYVLFADGATGVPIQVALAFQPTGDDRSVGGTATSTSGGIVSTRLGNGAPWTPMLDQAPFGRWRVTFPEPARIRELLDEAIDDIAFVVSYSGRTPEWPD